MRATKFLLAAGCAAALTGCGSAAHHRRSSASNAFLAFSKCMRAHGVTNLPDPHGHGLNLDGTGINPAAPVFQAANSHCQKLLPGGGPGGHGPPTKQAVQQMVGISRCMRAHGVTGFPDPTLTPISPADLSRYALAEDRGGVILAIPKTIDVKSPAFQQASKACGFR